jgi:hypothetical protein
MQNRAFGPYLMTDDRILISVMMDDCMQSTERNNMVNAASPTLRDHAPTSVDAEAIGVGNDGREAGAGVVGNQPEVGLGFVVLVLGNGLQADKATTKTPSRQRCRAAIGALRSVPRR